MKTLTIASLATAAVLFASASTATAGGLGIYVGTFPSQPAYPAYPTYGASHYSAYAAPPMAYQPAPATYAPMTYRSPAPAYQPGYGGPRVNRHRARVRYRPLFGDYVYKYRGRVRW